MHRCGRAAGGNATRDLFRVDDVKRNLRHQSHGVVIMFNTTQLFVLHSASDVSMRTPTGIATESLDVLTLQKLTINQTK
jgi:hypothetical protein